VASHLEQSLVEGIARELRRTYHDVEVQGPASSDPTSGDRTPGDCWRCIVKHHRPSGDVLELAMVVVMGDQLQFFRGPREHYGWPRPKVFRLADPRTLPRILEALGTIEL
jgi:hypothetical protein